MNAATFPMFAAALCGALVLTACDRDARPETAAVVGGSPATAPRPPAPVSDASLPSATSTVGAQSAPAPTSQDSKATEPMKDMSKQEESTAMPKANQANNHSSTALDPKTNKP